jgi:septum formation protein
MNLILASASPYRKALLQRLLLPFDCEPADVDESPRDGEAPVKLAMRLAATKAAALEERFPEAVIVGSDQVACIDDELLGKPGNQQRAHEQLRKSSGRCVEFHTGLAVLAPGGRNFGTCESFRVHFRELDDGEIRRYLELEQPFDCAGSFKCEGLGISLFERLEGDDPTSLEGLPLIALCKILRKLGLDPLGS